MSDTPTTPTSAPRALKTLIVTSQITFVPRNYADFLDAVVEGASLHIAGLVVLKNNGPARLRDLLGLFWLGCWRLGRNLAQNLVTAPAETREEQFRRRGWTVLNATTMNDAGVIAYVRANHIDLIVNARTRCIYQTEILEAPRLGCVNVHHGLLPEYRGVLCDLHALAEGRPAGITVHRMTEKLDAGAILARKELSLPGETHFAAYLERTAREEGHVVAALIRETARLGALPEGAPNRCPRPIFTRTPSRSRIREFREKGIRL